MKSGLKWAVVAALMLSGGLEVAHASEREYFYSIRIPKTSLTCQEEARLLGERFKAATGLASVNGTCRGEVLIPVGDQAYPYYSLLVTYLAEAEQHPYRAYVGGSISWEIANDLTGLYPSYQECMADLGVQRIAFESETGLSVAAAACEVPQLDYGAGRFVLRLDGFGTPIRQLFAFEHDPRGLVDAGLALEIETLIADLGGARVKRLGDTYFYYAVRPLGLLHDFYPRFYRPEQCTSQLDQVRAISTALGSKSVIAHCLVVSDFIGENTHSMEVVRDRARLLSGDFGKSSETYYSFEECMADRARAMTQARSRGRNPLGALCHSSPANGLFIVEIFSAI